MLLTRTRLYIILAIVFLVVLAFIYTIFSIFRSNSAPEQTSNPLPTPRTVELGGRSAPPTTYKNDGLLSSEQIAELDKLRAGLPFHSDSFDLDYSPEQGQFLVSLKSGDAQEDFQNFLKSRGLGGLNNSRFNLFFFSTDSITNLVKKAKSQGTTSDGLSEEGIKNMTDFTSVIFNSRIAPTITFDENGNVVGNPPTATPRPNQNNNNNSSEKLQEVLEWAGKIHQNLQRCGSWWDKMTARISNKGYTAHQAAGKACGGMYYACTYFIIDSYNLAGVKGITTANSNFVYKMRSFLKKAGKPFKHIPYSNASNKKDAIAQVKPGCILMMGDTVGHEHVEIIKTVRVNEKGDGTITAFDTNTSNPNDSFPVFNGSIRNLLADYDPVDFACLVE